MRKVTIILDDETWIRRGAAVCETLSPSRYWLHAEPFDDGDLASWLAIHMPPDRYDHDDDDWDAA